MTNLPPWGLTKERLGWINPVSSVFLLTPANFIESVGLSFLLCRMGRCPYIATTEDQVKRQQARQARCWLAAGALQEWI